MSTELTNLLPPQKIQAVKRTYFLHLFTIGLGIIFLIVVALIVLLIPSYMSSSLQVREKQTQLESMNASLETTEGKEIIERTKALEETVVYLTRIEKTPIATEAIRAILEVPHQGIALSGFTFTAQNGPSTTPKMGVSGLAASRDSLRRYVLSLESLSFVTTADLPISAYAKDTEIPFTISLSGTFVP